MEVVHLICHICIYLVLMIKKLLAILVMSAMFQQKGNYVWIPFLTCNMKWCVSSLR